MRDFSRQRIKSCLRSGGSKDSTECPVLSNPTLLLCLINYLLRLNIRQLLSTAETQPSVQVHSRINLADLYAGAGTERAACVGGRLLAERAQMSPVVSFLPVELQATSWVTEPLAGAIQIPYQSLADNFNKKALFNNRSLFPCDVTYFLYTYMVYQILIANTSVIYSSKTYFLLLRLFILNILILMLEVVAALWLTFHGCFWKQSQVVWVFLGGRTHPLSCCDLYLFLF